MKKECNETQRTPFTCLVRESDDVNWRSLWMRAERLQTKPSCVRVHFLEMSDVSSANE